MRAKANRRTIAERRRANAVFHCFMAVILALTLSGEAEAAKKKKRKRVKQPAVEKQAPPAWANLVRDGPQGRICFAAAEPKSKFPSSYGHGAVFFLVSDWKSGGPHEQPSLSVGYPLNVQIPPLGIIESAATAAPKTRLYVDGQDAFVERADQERALVAAMRRGKDLRIEAVSADNVRTTYEFSLSGFGSALDAAAKDCA